MSLKKIDIAMMETGEVKTVEVVPEETVGQLMQRLGYKESTLVRDGCYRDLDDTFVGGPQEFVDFLLDDDGGAEPYRLGLATL